MWRCDTERFGPALVIQPGALGDVILTLPLLRLLREHVGVRRVDVMGHTANLEALQGRCGVTRLLCLDSVPLHGLFQKPEAFVVADDEPLVDFLAAYDFIVTFLHDQAGHFVRNLVSVVARTHGAEIVTIELRPAASERAHVATFFLKQFAEQMPVLDLDLSEALTNEPLLRTGLGDEDEGRRLLAEAGLSPWAKPIMLHPGSGGRQKCWPIEHYYELTERLKGDNRPAFFLVGPVEQECWESAERDQLATALPVLNNLSVGQVAAVLSCCGAFVGNDSGVGHLAGALGVPTTSVFGPTDPQQWQPLGPRVAVCPPGAENGADWPSVATVWQRFTETTDQKSL